MKKSPKLAVEFLASIGTSDNRELTFVETLTKIFRRTIHQAKNNLIFTRIKTQKAQDLTAYFDSDLSVNFKPIKVDDFVWNGQKRGAIISFSKSFSSDPMTSVKL